MSLKNSKSLGTIFTVDARTSLETIVVSFKQNLRVINKATNNYEKWVEKDGKKVKAKIKQEGRNWQYGNHYTKQLYQEK